MKKFFKKLFNVSNILAIIAAIIGVSMLYLPMFIELKKDYTTQTSVPWTFLGVSLLLFLCPNRFIAGLGKAVDKKADSL